MGGLMYDYNWLFGSEVGKYVSYMITLLRTRQVEIVFTFCILLVVYFVRQYLKNVRSNFPPGPFGLPIVGYLPFLSENTHLDFMELGKKYGDVFSLQLGASILVILNGAEAIKEAFLGPYVEERPPDNPLKFISPNSPFFVLDIHVWREHKRFIMQTLNDLGLGKSKIEYDVQDEIKHFLEVLKKQNGTYIDPMVPLSPSMSNNICALVLGRRYEYDDPERIFLDHHLHVLEKYVSQTSKSSFFPWLSRLPFAEYFFASKKCKQGFDHLNDFFSVEIRKRKEALDPKNVRDFIDSYLVEMKTRREKDPNTSFSDETLSAVLVDLLSAGSETVRMSILWLIYIMAAYPDIQQRIQQEIVDVIGQERMPQYQDQKRMPYTHAVILEVLRWKTIAPLSTMKYTTSDIIVGKYHLPQGTVVIGNLWAVHHDPQLWNEPDIFKPERFLNADGTGIVKSNDFMPFSIGKRACPGEAMANMELFLYFACILQKFNISFPEGTKPTFAGKLAMIYRTEPYKVRFLHRK